MHASQPDPGRQSLSVDDRARLEEATRLHGAGHLAEAETLYTALLSAPGAQVEVLCFVLGLLKTQAGEPEAALDFYDRAVALGQASAQLFVNRGDLRRQAGRRLEALEDYDRAIALRPDQASLQAQRGMLLAEMERPGEAIAAYDLALALEPANPRVHNNRGVALEGCGELMPALEAYSAALGLDPIYRHAHHNLGSVLLKLERFREASHSLECAIRLDPQVAESWNLFGAAQMGMLRYADGLKAFDRALALRPAYAEAHNNRSIALRRLTRFAESVTSAERAFVLDSTLIEALNSRGSALMQINRHEEALLDFNAALAVKPDFAAVFLNRGGAREALGDIEGALVDYRQTQRLDPSNVDARFNQALAYIRKGDFARGWPLYEARWEDRNGPFLPYPDRTLWLGGEDIAGKTVLLWGEQGFGDVIQFCRFAKDVAARGARVLLQTKPELLRLLERLDGPHALIPIGEEPPPPFDLYTPLMSLPMALGLSLPTVGRGAYLAADPAIAERWRQRLGPPRGRRVGLAWAGNPQHENDHNRSMPFAALEPLVGQGLELVSLQKTHTEEDRRRLESHGVRLCENHLADFADTAGLISACDAVVAVDTSVAHLAAAMGRPAFMLLPRHPDWRWMQAREDTPWYPSLRLMRQAEAGDWSAPVAATLDALRRLQV